MQINKEQTFWNNFMNDKKLKTFSDWVGDSEAESKVFFYNYIKNKNFKSILDMGCGNATISAGLKKNNIDSAIHYSYVLPKLKIFSKFTQNIKVFRNAIKLSKELVSLPIYPELTLKKQLYVIRIVNKILNSKK